MIYMELYLAVKRHQIQVLQVQQVAHASKMAFFSRLAKSAVAFFYA